LLARGEAWLSHICFATLDLSGTYRSVFDAVVPLAVQVADPFHVVKHANQKLDECRRQVPNETLGHRGHQGDPLYRCRRLLTRAEQRLDEAGTEKLLGLLRTGDPRGEVTTTWHAKEAVRKLYSHTDEALARVWIDRLIEDMADTDNPIEVRSLGRTLKRWKEQIVAWHRSHATNGPTEAANNLIKRVKRAAFGMRSFRNYRIRSILYAGKVNWSLLRTLTPRRDPKCQKRAAMTRPPARTTRAVTRLFSLDGSLALAARGFIAVRCSGEHLGTAVEIGTLDADPLGDDAIPHEDGKDLAAEADP
jgi:transposase